MLLAKCHNSGPSRNIIKNMNKYEMSKPSMNFGSFQINKGHRVSCKTNVKIDSNMHIERNQLGLRPTSSLFDSSIHLDGNLKVKNQGSWNYFTPDILRMEHDKKFCRTPKSYGSHQQLYLDNNVKMMSINDPHRRRKTLNFHRVKKRVN